MRHGFRVMNKITILNHNQRDIMKQFYRLMRDAGTLEKWFGRPCPWDAQHGFIDSVRFDKLSTSGIDTMFDSSIAASHGGPPEFIIMPFIEAKFSAVMTDTGLTIGRGHDGATGGAGIDFPGSGPWMDNLFACDTDELKTNAGITDSPFGEIVCGDNNYVVQIRNGPELPAAQNFLPRDLTVAQVISVDDPMAVDLVQWETLIKEADPDSVICLGSLASHLAIHGVQRGIAVVTDGRKIAAGDKLKKEESHIGLDMELNQRKYLAEAIQEYGMGHAAVDGETAKFCMAVLHSITQHGQAQHMTRVKAFAAIHTLRHIAAACLGELRYGSGNRQPVGHGEYMARVADGDSDSRSSYWKRAKWFSWYEAERQLAYAKNTFNDSVECSYGGKKWKRAASLGYKFSRKLRRFVKWHRQEDWLDTVDIWNQTVAACHNGGVTLFSKFTGGQEILNTVATFPALGFMNETALKIGESDLS
jgi:hypothetical protein